MVRRTIALGLLLAVASPLRAQGRSPRVDVSIPSTMRASTGTAATMISGILTEGHRREMLQGGWPTQIHGRLQLWRKGGWLGQYSIEADYEWDVVVEYSQTARTYHIRRIIDNLVEDLGEAATLEAAELILRKPFNPPLSPERSGSTYFYLFSAEVSTLSLSDLEAWNRWLRGEATPAVQGKRNPVGAVQRGLGALFSRMLGGDTQTYERRSSSFTAG